MNIERFSDARYEEVKQLVLGVLEEKGFEYDPVKDYDLDDITKYYHDNGGMFFTGSVDRKIIGTSAVRKIDSERCEIKRIYVCKEYRRRGYGRELFLHALDFAKDHYLHITLMTDRSLTEAIALYKKYGFSVVRTDSLQKPYILMSHSK
ncbi:MAG: acetyltransferase [ANME-2 cluster archaeon HR1]|nr:MAG: acetyltransferase [ANME-2 cluster archaeon HR1]